MKCRRNNIMLFLVILLSFICFFPQKVNAEVMENYAQTDLDPQPCATITLNKNAVSLEKGKTVKLKATVENCDAEKIIWTSGNKKVATVTKSGKVKAKYKEQAVITARLAGTDVMAQAVITVKNYITMRVRTTGYCNCRKCAGKWAGCATAIGTKPRAKRTIAVDKRLIRLGSKVQMDNKMYVAEDTGGAIKGKRIDVYYASHKKATSHGVKYKKIKVYY